jgi:hypothetical protein
LKSLKEGLERHFGVKDLGELKFCLGLNIDRNIANGEIRINQRNYISDVLQRFNMEDCKGATTPIETKLDLFETEERESCLDVPYQRLIGCLMYIAVCTRPDIAFSVSFLSQFNNRPRKIHWSAAKRVLQYLKYTIDYSLCYRKTDEKLCGYVDSDWANRKDRRSYTGYVFKYSNGPISWECKKQTTVALSSTEAEYMALSSASKEAIFLARFISEVSGESAPVILFNDNQSAQRLAVNPVHHNRTKHIDVRHHFIRELIEQNIINLCYLQSGDMIADILTKGLPRPKVVKCVLGLGLVN